jgi:hypothetical protein
MNKKEIYYLVSQTLSLSVRPNIANELIEMLPKDKKDWENWVQMGNKHLVLQTLYVALKNNKLLQFLPADLAEYLQYIHRLNVERNQRVIQQARALKEIFDREQISHVFMKGTANIVDGLYADIGERLVYDIDILVDENRMLNAAGALIASGYKTQKKFNPKAYPSTMHYPILVHEGFVAGVEIHRLPVQYLYVKRFSAERVFETKRLSKWEKGFWVMSDKNKLIHNFVHSQLMHNGHYHADVSLRDLYDMLLLNQRENAAKVFEDFKYFQSKSSAYLNLMHKVLSTPVIGFKKMGGCGSFFMVRHHLTLSMSRKQRVFYHLLVASLIKYVVLPFRTIFNANARNYVFSRLKNPHWYSEHINAYRRKFSKSRKQPNEGLN